MVDTVGNFEVALAHTLAGVGASAALHERSGQRCRHHDIAVNGSRSDVSPVVPEGLAAPKARGLKTATTSASR